MTHQDWTEIQDLYARMKSAFGSAYCGQLAFVIQLISSELEKQNPGIMTDAKEAVDCLEEAGIIHLEVRQ